jgi:hypothetical protein
MDVCSVTLDIAVKNRQLNFLQPVCDNFFKGVLLRSEMQANNILKFSNRNP